MEKSRTLSDEPGYIYTFEIRDPNSPSTIKLKVGRAVNLNKRIDQWGKQCSSKEQVLRGWYPGIVEPDDSGTCREKLSSLWSLSKLTVIRQTIPSPTAPSPS